MREILFRGKRIDNGKWVEGDLLRTKFYLDDSEHSLIFTATVEFPRSEFGGANEVSSESVGQFTGVYDKNDRRIFEGDIIRIPDDYDTYGMNAGEVYEVYFGFGGFRLKPKYRKNARGYFLEDSGEVEVIGNIHDNPELIAEVEGC